MEAHFAIGEGSGDNPFRVGFFPPDPCALNGGPVLICYHDLDGGFGHRIPGPSEPQTSCRCVRNNRKENLIALFYLLLAPAYLSGPEFEVYLPKRCTVFASTRFIIDGRDYEIIKRLEVFPVRFSSVNAFVQFGFSIPYPSKPKLRTLLASSSAVVHVGPTQSLLLLLVPLQ